MDWAFMKWQMASEKSGAFIMGGNGEIIST